MVHSVFVVCPQGNFFVHLPGHGSIDALFVITYKISPVPIFLVHRRNGKPYLVFNQYLVVAKFGSFAVIGAERYSDSTAIALRIGDNR